MASVLLFLLLALSIVAYISYPLLRKSQGRSEDVSDENVHFADCFVPRNRLRLTVYFSNVEHTLFLVPIVLINLNTWVKSLA